MDKDNEPDEKPRIIAVKLPRKYHRTVRRLAVQHELANAQVICWAIDLLQRYSNDGGLYAGR